jgi:uncharacterized protein YijF (DUF1287 family)
LQEFNRFDPKDHQLMQRTLYLLPLIASLACGSRMLTTADRIVASARDQLNWGTTYDPSYIRIKFPGGDVPRTQGVCTDVVVRALRTVGKDLQGLIHQDKCANPDLYPKYTGQKGADPNIDHRRCPNLRVFFRRYGKGLPNRTDSGSLSSWKPGDIVFWKLDNGRDHVGIVTDRKGPSGVPWAIHNLSTPAEEPVLAKWTIVAHFRYPKG